MRSRWSGDKRLAGRLAQGDSKAWEEFFETHRDRAYRVAVGILSRREESLDAAQEAFVKAIEAVKGYRAQASLGTWFMRVVTNTALDALRRRLVRPQTQAGEAVFGTKASKSPSPVAQAEANELSAAAAELVAALPEKQRVVFSLFTYGALSYAEIAEALEISRGTVMSRLFYAREALGKGLAERGFDVDSVLRRPSGEQV